MKRTFLGLEMWLETVRGDVGKDKTASSGER